MGLFGSKKPEKTAKMKEFFSEQDLKTIVETVEPKVKRRMYGKYASFAETLLAAAKDPETILVDRELRSMSGLLFSAGAMTKMEPSLKPILQPAIEKLRAFSK